MSQLNSQQWFTEACELGKSAFSLEIKHRCHEEQTPFQKIEIYETEGFGHLMVIDGFVMLTQRDNFLYHEMMSHPALFTHPNPEHVVIVGGGDCGTLREVLKHPGVKQATQVEIDERVTRLSETYFPELCTSNNDPRASLIFDDAIQWMKNAAPGSVDIIIVDSTDPIGPAEGLFTEAFYKDCFRCLGDEGLVIQQSESPLYHISLIKAMRVAMLAAGFSACHTLPFPQPCYPSGWWSATLASKPGNTTKFRISDVDHKAFNTQYYNAGIHAAALATPEFMKEL